jgi:hypothetical protein
MDFVQNGMTKNLGQNFVFIFNRGILEQKLWRKVASPISGKNTQMIACWYKTYIRQKGEKTKKMFCLSASTGLREVATQL